VYYKVSQFRFNNPQGFPYELLVNCSSFVFSFCWAQKYNQKFKNVLVLYISFFLSRINHILKNSSEYVGSSEEEEAKNMCLRKIVSGINNKFPEFREWYFTLYFVEDLFSFHENSRLK